MNTTTKTPIETAMAINTARRVDYLIGRIENLVRMEIKVQERDGNIESKRNELDWIAYEMMDTRKELIHLATK